MEQWQMNAIGTEIDKIYGRLDRYYETAKRLSEQKDLFGTNANEIASILNKVENETGKLDGIRKTLRILGYEIGYDAKMQMHEVYSMKKVG